MGMVERNEEPQGNPLVSCLELDWNMIAINRRGMFRWKWLDVLESVDEKWYQAQIVGYNPNSRSFIIHYKGFHSKFDEEIPIHSNRTAPLHTHTKPPDTPHNSLSLYPGMQLDVQDPFSNWCKGLLLSIDQHYGLAEVSYVSRDRDFTEWIYAESHRLAPLGEHTEVEHPERGMWKMGKQGMRATQENEISFREMLARERGWEVVVVQGDGNCLFRAISHQVYGSSDHHAMIREKCADYMLVHSSFFGRFVEGDSFEEYISNLRRPGVWGDHVEIQALSELYSRPIEVYAYQLVPMNTYSRSDHREPLRLSYHCQSHYNSIVGKDQQQYPLRGKMVGSWESEMISNARRRLEAQEREEKELEWLDEEQLMVALIESRREFGQISLEEFETSLQAALNASFDEEVKRVLDESVDELASIENRQLDVALHQSMSSLHPAIRAGMELGYSLPTCEDAFGIVASMIGPQSEQTMTQYLINYLLEGELL